MYSRRPMNKCERTALNGMDVNKIPEYDLRRRTSTQYERICSALSSDFESRTDERTYRRKFVEHRNPDD